LQLYSTWNKDNKKNLMAKPTALLQNILYIKQADETSYKKLPLKKGISCSKQTDMTRPGASFTLQQ
jgi:hypothetical protein